MEIATGDVIREKLKAESHRSSRRLGTSRCRRLLGSSLGLHGVVQFGLTPEKMSPCELKPLMEKLLDPFQNQIIKHKYLDLSFPEYIKYLGLDQAPLLTATDFLGFVDCRDGWNKNVRINQTHGVARWIKISRYSHRAIKCQDRLQNFSTSIMRMVNINTNLGTYKFRSSVFERGVDISDYSCRHVLRIISSNGHVTWDENHHNLELQIANDFH